MYLHYLKISGLAGFVLLYATSFAFSQITYDEIDGRTNAVNTAVPFLRISPDARSGAMGDAGIALSPDANAVYWNFSKTPFAKKDIEVSATYTPWLREMADDVFLAYLSGFKKIGNRQTVGLSLRYFDMGNIQLTNFQGEDQGKTHPREFSVDGGYARKLSDQWSVGVALRYIHSYLLSGVKEGEEAYKAGNAVAGDVSVYYTSPGRNLEDLRGIWRFGATLTNLGTKISYKESGNDKYFIPSNLGLG